MFVDGFHKSRNLVVMSIYYLSINEKNQTDLRHDIEQVSLSEITKISEFSGYNYLDAVLSETLRHSSLSARTLPQKSIDDHQLGSSNSGVKVSNGTFVTVGLLENNYNSNYYPAGEKFDLIPWLKKKNNVCSTYISCPFSVNCCWGRNMGLIEVQSVLIYLTRNYKYKLNKDYKH